MMKRRMKSKTFVDSHNKNLDYQIIIQHFCLETWALGNRVIITRNPISASIREYRKYFDVLVDDPELLPGYPKQYPIGLNLQKSI